MKPLKERLAEKAARQAKEDAKLSGKVKCFRFSLPFNGYPYMSKESDVKYVKDRAFALVKKIRSFSAHQLYEGLKEAISAEEKRIAETRIRRSWWEPQNLINSGISKYIVVVQKEDGTLKGEDGTIYVKQTPEPKPEAPARELDLSHLAREAVDPIVTSNLCVDGLEAPTTRPMTQAETIAEVERLRALERRTSELSHRVETLQDSRPETVERAHRLLEESSAVEADLQELLRDLEQEEDGTSPAVNSLPENMPTSGVALSHSVENNITPTPLRTTEPSWVLRHREIESSDLTPEQEDAIVQPSIDHIQPIAETPLPEGLTFPMDYIYSIASESRPAPIRSLRGPLARSARRRRNIIRQASESI